MSTGIGMDADLLDPDAGAADRAGPLLDRDVWAAHRFTQGWPGFVRRQLNGRYDDVCDRLGGELRAQAVAHDLPDDEVRRIWADVVLATRRSSVMWTIPYFASSTVRWITDAAVYVAATVAVAQVDGLAPWTSWALLGVALLFVALAVFEDVVPEKVLAAAAFMWCGCLVVLVAFPPGIGMLWRTLALLVASVLTWSVLALGRLVLKVVPLFPGLMLVVVLDCVALYVPQGVVHLMHEHLGVLPTELLRAASAGLTVGAVLGLTVAAVEILNQLAIKWEIWTRLRGIPEPEFVQSALWLLANQSDEGAQPWRRRDDLVREADWMAQVLEHAVGAHLCRLDPQSAVEVGPAFRRKAAALHRSKLDVLLGAAGAVDGLTAMVWDMACTGAARAWSELLEVDVDATPAVPVRDRALTWTRRLLVLAVAAGGALVAFSLQQKEIAGTLAVAAVLLLLEVVNPDSSSKLGKAVSDAKVLVAPPTPRHSS
ncbi:hypothetical protein [Cellulomonas sp.]|uniref:hypothetical protein n=1 Tax=Cellulomonas sp. TaxID=40001 RepID=UPI001B26F830|nr:hypothetical protein [Cellulomonas sp.]MBO9553550.1 hypothetical protein [Cellulomonas sp.]